jgi:hypothetical protein
MIHRVESTGSIWEIDVEDMRYRRFPKEESPREKPEWGNSEDGLKDFVWHDFIEWRVTDTRLIITTQVTDKGPVCVVAPLPSDQGES